jgi:hypothetical protein
MGLAKKEKVSYLKITDGKIRQRTTQDDPQAEERHDDINNKFLYERVYSSCTGYIKRISVQTHEDFGEQFILSLYDPDTEETFALSMGGGSRYFQSLCMHLPNIDFAKPVTVKPYSFKSDKSNNTGITFYQGGVKVQNYYKSWDEDTKTSTAMNGMEKFDFSKVKGDKDDMRILQIKVAKFLKAELKKQVIRLEEFCEANPVETYSIGSEIDDDGDDVELEVKHAPSTPSMPAVKDTAKTVKVKPERGRVRNSRMDEDIPF